MVIKIMTELLDLNDEVNEVEDINQAIVDSSSDTNTLVQVKTILEGVNNNSEEISLEAAKLTNIILDSIKDRVGVKTPTVSLEDYPTIDKNYLIVSLEDFKETIDKIIQAVKDAITFVRKTIVNLFKRIMEFFTNNDTKYEDDLAKLKDKVENKNVANEDAGVTFKPATDGFFELKADNVFSNTQLSNFYKYKALKLHSKTIDYKVVNESITDLEYKLKEMTDTLNHIDSNLIKDIVNLTKSNKDLYTEVYKLFLSIGEAKANSNKDTHEFIYDVDLLNRSYDMTITEKDISVNLDVSVNNIFNNEESMDVSICSSHEFLSLITVMSSFRKEVMRVASRNDLDKFYNTILTNLDILQHKLKEGDLEDKRFVHGRITLLKHLESVITGMYTSIIKLSTHQVSISKYYLDECVKQSV
jgi:hypothetical protein